MSQTVVCLSLRAITVVIFIWTLFEGRKRKSRPEPRH
jgi:hypothetical protein